MEPFRLFYETSAKMEIKREIESRVMNNLDTSRNYNSHIMEILFLSTY